MQHRRRARPVCAPRGAATPGDARKSAARNRLCAPAARRLIAYLGFANSTTRFCAASWSGSIGFSRQYLSTHDVMASASVTRRASRTW